MEDLKEQDLINSILSLTKQLEILTQKVDKLLSQQERILLLKNDSARLYTTKEVVEKLRISNTAVYNLMNMGELESIKIGGLRRFTEKQILDYIEKRSKFW